MITLSVDMSDTIAAIEKKVLDSLAKIMNDVLQHARSGVISGIQDLCDKLIRRTPEFEALWGHDFLLGELGVPDIEQRLNAILEGVKRGVMADIIPVKRQGSGLAGGMLIGIIPSELGTILSLPESSYETEKGQTIPWLDWLAQQGDRVLVWGYDVEMARTSTAKARSRTGLALMVKGTGWRIDPRYVGFPHNNFFTRAFDVPGVESAVGNIIAQEIYKRV
jgi:hypothetical protein